MKKAYVSSLAFAILAVTEVSCLVSYPMQSASLSPKVYAVADRPNSETPGAAPVYSRAEAVKYCRTQLDAVAPCFSIKLKYGTPVTEMNILTQDMLDTGLAIAMQLECVGNRVVFTPTYSDCVLMLRAHRNPAYASALSPKMHAALKRAQRIVAEISRYNYTDYAIAKALHDYIVLNTRYESRLGITAQDDATSRLLLEGIAVCDGYAHTYGLLLSMAGIENRFVIGKADGVEHIWNLVKLQGQWTHIDPTYDDPKPDVEGRIYHAYFGLSDARISVNHQWDSSNFPRAITDSLFHPIHEGYRFSTAREMLLWAAENPYGRPWAATIYVDEFAHIKSDEAVHTKLKYVSEALGLNVLKTVGVDPGIRGAIFCSFRY